MNGKIEIAEKLLNICAIEDGTIENTENLTPQEIETAKQQLIDLITRFILVEEAAKNLQTNFNSFEQPSEAANDNFIDKEYHNE